MHPDPWRRPARPSPAEGLKVLEAGAQMAQQGPWERNSEDSFITSSIPQSQLRRSEDCIYSLALKRPILHRFACLVFVFFFSKYKNSNDQTWKASLHFQWSRIVKTLLGSVLLVVLGGRKPPGRDTGMGKRAEGFYSQFFIFTVPTAFSPVPFFLLTFVSNNAFYWDRIHIPDHSPF